MYTGNPPPLFKQGTSARLKAVLFSVIAIVLLVVDARFNTLDMMRQAVGTVLYPLQILALKPRDAIQSVGNYFTRLSTLEKENADLKHAQLTQSLEIQRGRQLQHENVQLRRLLGAKEHLAVVSITATVLYDARDSFNRRVIVDKGINHGVVLGQPVIDDQGVIGQITRVFSLTSEVTLLTDKEQVIPVQVQRNGLRGLVYGKGQIHHLEMQVPGNADIKVDDVLVTSGIDGIYPEGLSVAHVARMENDGTSTFERAVCEPIAGLDRNKQVLILLVDTHAAPRPGDDEKNNKPKKVNRRITRDSAKPNQNEQ